jgi:hypothetical protein
MADRGVDVGEDLTDSQVTTGDRNRIRRDGQSQSVIMADRDVTSLLHSVEREIQVVHREIQGVRNQLRDGVWGGMLILLLVIGIAIFVGDRQIAAVNSRLHDMEVQQRRYEIQLGRIERMMDGSNVAPDYSP